MSGEAIRIRAAKSVLKSVLGGSIVLSLLSMPAFAVPTYTVTDLGTFGGTISNAMGINNSGQIVGSAYTSGNAAIRAFLYDGTSMTDIGTFGGTSSLVSRSITMALSLVSPIPAPPSMPMPLSTTAQA